MRRPFRFARCSLLAAGLVLACSSDEPSTPAAPVDAGHDASLDADTSPEAGLDGSQDVIPEGSITPQCPEGSWGNVPSTQCDLIEQDCENKLLTCYPNVQGGKPGSSCVSVGYGAKTKGMPCDSKTDCASGLLCLAKYCTPFCCPDYEYQICGPGGRCDVNVALGAGYAVRICSYSKPCTLWAHECPPGEACQPVAEDGSASCTPPATGSFVGEGDVCTARNDCGDDQGCVTQGMAPAACRYYCKLGDSPWDAGAADGGPGGGGCPEGQSCLPLADAPSWLGVCAPQ